MNSKLLIYYKFIFMDKSMKVFAGVVIVLCVLSFYGGMKYAQGSASGVNQQNPLTNTSRASQFAGRAGRNGGGFVSGTVLSKDATGFTVKLTDGGSKIVFLSSSSTVMKSTAGTIDDVSMGTQVVVNGSANTDGSVTAQSIQIRPPTSTFPGR
jgi:hypothetical protein